MADLSKISQTVQKFVKNVQEMEGKKNRIDTKAEYDKLGEYLSGNKDNMNVHEKDFIERYMSEYKDYVKREGKKAEQKRIEEATTDDVKDTVKDIKKRMGDKAKIDTDEEANALLLMLKNTKGDLNKADIEYIKNVLKESGYGSYLEPKEDVNKGGKAEAAGMETPAEPAETVVTPITGESNAQKSEEPVEKKTEPDNNGYDKPVQSEKKPKRRSGRPARPAKPQTPPADTKSAPNTSSKPAVKPKVTEKGRNRGLRFAHIVKTELESNWADNSKIHDTLRSVDSSSAYTFVSQFVQINQDVFKISDTFNKITYFDTLHVMESLLEQAKGMGLEKNPAYVKLQKTVEFGRQSLQNGTLKKYDPTEQMQKNADRDIAALYREMSRVLK